MPSRVFISYSSKSAEALNVRDALRIALTSAGYKVFVDRWDLKPGDIWRRKILLALAKCTAGVILLSNDTLENHPWVLYEASILSFRRELDPHFRLIPVLIEDVKLEHLKATRFFSPLALDESQFAEAGQQAQLVEKIQKALGPASQRIGQKTLLQELTEQFLKKIKHLPDEELQDAASNIKKARALTAWPREHCLKGISTALARLVLLEGTGGMTKAIDALLEPLGAEKAMAFLHLIAPLWIQAEQAGRLKKLSERASRPKFLALNSKHGFKVTAKAYVDRAYWPEMHQGPELIFISPALPEDLVAHVAKGVVDHYLVNAPRYAGDRKQVESYLERKKPAFIALLPAELWPNDKELQKLYERYPNATFILHTGEAPRAMETLPPNIEPLPKVDDLEEGEAHDACIELEARINRFARQGGQQS